MYTVLCTPAQLCPRPREVVTCAGAEGVGVNSHSDYTNQDVLPRFMLAAWISTTTLRALLHCTVLVGTVDATTSASTEILSCCPMPNLVHTYGTSCPETALHPPPCHPRAVSPFVTDKLYRSHVSPCAPTLPKIWMTCIIKKEVFRRWSRRRIESPSSSTGRTMFPTRHGPLLLQFLCRHSIALSTYTVLCTHHHQTESTYRSRCGSKTPHSASCTNIPFPPKESSFA